MSPVTLTVRHNLSFRMLYCSNHNNKHHYDYDCSSSHSYGSLCTSGKHWRRCCHLIRRSSCCHLIRRSQHDDEIYMQKLTMSKNIAVPGLGLLYAKCPPPPLNLTIYTHSHVFLYVHHSRTSVLNSLSSWNTAERRSYHWQGGCIQDSKYRYSVFSHVNQTIITDGLVLEGDVTNILLISE